MAQSVSGKQDAAGSGTEINNPLPFVRGVTKAQIADWVFRNLTLLCALSAALFIFGIALTLILASRLSFVHSSLQFFRLSAWDPVAPDAEKHTGNIFGVLPFVYGTLITSALALLIAIPLGVGAAIFLAEIAPRKLSAPISFVVEMLAAVPSIVYGYWALLYLVPQLQSGMEQWLNTTFGHIPLFATYSDTGSGMDYLAAGLILALMVLPFIAAISRDILRSVPQAQREAAYGLGATKWEATQGVVLKYASSGIIGAIMLGLGRAIGETMAVTMVIGSKINIPHLHDPASFSLFRPGYTMTAILVDQYPSPNSPLHISALTEVALTLFLVTIIVNGLARGLVWLTAMRAGGSSSDTSIKAKAVTATGLRLLFSGLVILAFLYQAISDVRSKGIAGLFGGAEWIGLLLLALVLFNRRVPGSRFFMPWRRICNVIALALCSLCALVASGALVTLFYFVFKEGFSSINVQFFRPPNPANPDTGGMLHAIVGTAEFMGMSALLGVPLGILGGAFLAEFGTNRLGFWMRFATDLLNGVPSIVLGIFAYQLIIVPTHNNFGIAGGFALGIMMIPTVMRSTEELIRLVPQGLREGSLALGATHARTVWQVVLPSARAGIITGVLLALARVAGETAPLLMVGCNSQLWNLNPRGQLASLPVQIYVLRDAPTELAQRQSWGVALILVLMVLIMSLLARLATRDKLAARQ